MDCSVCGKPSGHHALCGSHRRMLATCSDLTPEQIRSSEPSAPLLGLIDMFGVTHLLPAKARVGRDPDTCEVAILHASISLSHALLTAAGDRITIHDQKSLNGTFVGNERVSTRTLQARDGLVRFGAVSFMMTPDAIDRLAGAPHGRRTVPRAGKGSRVTLLAHGTRWELSIGGEGARLAGGQHEVALSLMEGRLLGALLARSANTEFLSSAALVSELGFGSRAPDGENVRELVRRLRRKLDAVGLGDLVVSRRRAGYRIARDVTLA